MSFNDGTAGVGIQSFVNQVEVFRRGGADAWNGLRLLAGLVEAPLGIHRSNLLVALENIDDGPLAAVILVVFLSVRLADERVRAQRHFVAVSHFLFGLTIEGGTENSDDQDGDAEVDDVAAVAARVPVQ